MKYRIFCLALVLMLSGLLFAGKITYDDSLGPQGFSVNESSTSGVSLIYSINEFSIEDFEIEGELRKTIQLPGVFLPNTVGAPNLPSSGTHIAIPQNSIASYTITYSRTETINNIDIAPAPLVTSDSDDSPLTYDEDIGIYSSDSYYPENHIILEDSDIRGLDAVILRVVPFQYNPVSKELIVYRDLRINVSFEGGNGHFGDDGLRNRYWDEIQNRLVINSEVINEYDYSTNLKSDGCEYLIICPNQSYFLGYANQLKEFRTKQGIITDITVIGDLNGIAENTRAAIEGYINNAFKTWSIKPVAVLLMGDWGIKGSTGTIYSPTYTFRYPAPSTRTVELISDNFYADLGGDFPDFAISRMTAQNEEQLRVMVSKIIDYETQPPHYDSFYNNPVTAMGWQTDRWYQVFTETLGGFMREELGKVPVRVNEGREVLPETPWTSESEQQLIQFFGPNGKGYIPETPYELVGFTGGTHEQIVEAINNGAFLVQHRDHGGIEGWRDPYFRNHHIDLLENEALPFVMSLNCLTGKFDTDGECFAEKMHRYTHEGKNSGALGILAATEESPSYYNDVFGWGFYNYFWNIMDEEQESLSFNPAFANVYAKHYLNTHGWVNDSEYKKWVSYLYHLHGDPFMNIYTEMPQILTVSYDKIYEGQEFFNITVEDGAYISLVVDGEIIGRGESTGNTAIEIVDPQPEGTAITLTVTKQNYYRYETTINVGSSKSSHADKYAVLIAGDYNTENIPPDIQWNNGEGDCSEFWNDLFLQWEMLYNEGFKDENIYVVFANGMDHWLINDDINIRYRAESITGNTDETITNYSATRKNLETISNILNDRMKSDSYLYVWAMSHGGSSTQSSLCLIDPANPNSYDEMTDSDFAGLFKNLPANKKIYNISANYAQGFKTALQDGNALIQVSSTDTKALRADDRDGDGSLIPFLENEEINGRIYYHGETNFHSYISLTGRRPLGQDEYSDIPLASCDTDGDGFVSISESYDWVVNQESVDQIPGIDNEIMGEHTSLKFPTLIHDNYIDYSLFLKGLMAIPVSLTIDNADLVLASYSETTVIENSTVTVNSGCDFTVQENSNLYLQDQTGLDILSGNINLMQETAINVMPDSKVYINGENTNWDEDSKLSVQEGASFTSENSSFLFSGASGFWSGIGCDKNSTIVLNNVNITGAEIAVLGFYTDCKINASTFTGCTNGFALVNCDNYSISSNTLTGADTGTGISLAVSNGYFQNNSIENFRIGVKFTSCSPVISKNNISNNLKFGVLSFGHNAYPQLVLSSKVSTATNNTLLNNGTNTEFTTPFAFPDAQIGIMPFGNVYLEGGKNNIYSTEHPGFMPCISVSPKYISEPGVIIDNSEVLIKAAENYWGEHLYDSCFKLAFNYSIDYTPWAEEPYTGETTNQNILSSNEPPSTESIMLSNALFLEEEGRYTASIKQYEKITDKYSDSPEYYVAMARLPLVYSKAGISTDPLIETFDAALESDNTTHKKFFREMKIATHIKGKNYPTAKLLAQQMKEEALTEDEVTLADIDIAICDIMMGTGNKAGNTPADQMAKLNELLSKSYRDGDKSEPISLHEGLVPTETVLYQNYPNPFNPVTQIKFTLAQDCQVKLAVYNINGQLVSELFSGQMNTGMHSVNFDASNFNSGMYFYTLEANGSTFTNKMILTK